MEPSIFSALLSGLVVVAAAFLALWAASLPARDASIVDPFWGMGFVLLALLYADASGPVTMRGRLITGLVLVWGIRLTVHLLLRRRGKGEDFRYGAMRRRHGPRFWWVSLFTVFLLQAVVLWIVSFPLYHAQRGFARAPLGWTDVLGVLVFALGFLFEALSDFQLARFKRDPVNQDRVLDTGLWRYSRHPNYFGDALVWWGFFLIAIGTPGGWWTVVSPVLMTFLLMRVSGVTLLEETLERSKPDYRHYTDKTSAFFPWFPR
jgi:steroid 5-alpha reductase family enzyme